MGRGGKSMRGGYKGGNSSLGSAFRQNRGGPRKPPLTHFLCLPLVTEATRPQLEASLARFRGLVAEENESPNAAKEIPLKAIRPLGTIHFTLGVMSLTSVDKISEVIGFLQTLDIKNLMNEIVEERQVPLESRNARALRISLASLHSMHPPKKTSILYAGPKDPKDVLHPFCVKLRDVFRQAGFLVPDDRPLKLHATIVNTIYAKTGGRGMPAGAATSSISREAKSQEKRTTNKSGGSEPAAIYTTSEVPTDTSHGHGPNAKAPTQLDATDLLEKCRDYVWASDFAIERIAICKMGAKNIMDDEGNVVNEQYEEVASIPLPS